MSEVQRGRRSRVVFLHSSNEMYGADKILLEVIQALPFEDREGSLVWLPDDLPAAQNNLGIRLDSLGVRNLSAPLPVIRRRYLTFLRFWPLLRRLWMTFRLLRAERPDVVYCTTSAMIFCIPLARAAGIKNVVLHVQEIWSSREGPFMGLFARAASQIICISSAARESLPSHSLSRAALLVNAHRENSRPPVSHSTDSKELKFVVASRWNAWKGHETLLRAWDADRTPGKLVILGGAPVMGIGVDIPSLVAAVRYADHISVVGEVSDIAPHLDSADFLVLPSDRPEPFGLVLLEAFARGRAVVASNAGGAKDVVTHGHDGLLFQMGSAEELTACLLSLSRGEAQRMGANARLTYEEKFSIAAYGEQFRDIWDSITTNGTGREHAHS